MRCMQTFFERQHGSLRERQSSVHLCAMFSYNNDTSSSRQWEAEGEEEKALPIWAVKHEQGL